MLWYRGARNLRIPFTSIGRTHWSMSFAWIARALDSRRRANASTWWPRSWPLMPKGSATRCPERANSQSNPATTIWTKIGAAISKRRYGRRGKKPIDRQWDHATIPPPRRTRALQVGENSFMRSPEWRIHDQRNLQRPNRGALESTETDLVRVGSRANVELWPALSFAAAVQSEEGWDEWKAEGGSSIPGSGRQFAARRRPQAARAVGRQSKRNRSRVWLWLFEFLQRAE